MRRLSLAETGKYLEHCFGYNGEVIETKEELERKSESEGEEGKETWIFPGININFPTLEGSVGGWVFCARCY